MPTLVQYGALSTFLLGWAILSAVRMRPNYFSAAVYLSKSNACMLILWNFGVFCTVVFGKIMQKIFFGQLRMIEVERLNERAWFAITETLLALTIFREEFDTSFVALFISLLFVKAFHWLASDRVEFMEQTQNISIWFHLRMVSCLSALWLADSILLLFAAESILIDGPSVMIMFASEYLILLASIWGISAKYAINVYDSRRENWEAKSIYVFYTELVADFMKLCVYIAFFSLILTFYGLPLNTLRDLYMTARSFVLKCRDLVRYKQATRNMDEKYPNATVEEMDRLSDKTCIICREEMEARRADAAAPAAARNGPNETPKKLPCGHIFHFHCLRSWLERQQSCPTCRHSVLQPEPPRPGAAAPARPPQLPGVPPAANADAARDQLFNVLNARAGGPAAAPPQPGAVPRINTPQTIRRAASPAVPSAAARDTNPLVRFKTPLPPSGTEAGRAPWSPAPGFTDALQQHLMPSRQPSATGSSVDNTPVAARMQPTRSSPPTPTRPPVSSPSTLAVPNPLASTSALPTEASSSATSSAEEEAAKQRRERAAAAAARRIPRLSPPRAEEAPGPVPPSLRRTSSDSHAPHSQPLAGLGFLPSLSSARTTLPEGLSAVQASDLPRLIPLFDVAGVAPDFSGLPSISSLVDLVPGDGTSLPQWAPALQAAKASLDRCRAEVDACLQRVTAATSSQPLAVEELDRRIEALMIAKLAREAGNDEDYRTAMAIFEAGE